MERGLRCWLLLLLPLHCCPGSFCSSCCCCCSCCCSCSRYTAAPALSVPPAAAVPPASAAAPAAAAAAAAAAGPDLQVSQGKVLLMRVVEYTPHANFYVVASGTIASKNLTLLQLLLLLLQADWLDGKQLMFALYRAVAVADSGILLPLL